MSTKIGGRPIPKLTIEFPEGGAKDINLTGPVAARFLKTAREAMGYADKPFETWQTALEKEGHAMELDFEVVCRAVEGLFPNGTRKSLADEDTGNLMLSFEDYTELFREAWFKINGLMEEPDGKKALNSAELSPQS
jgi:hypothetical protein